MHSSNMKVNSNTSITNYCISVITRIINMMINPIYVILSCFIDDF